MKTERATIKDLQDTLKRKEREHGVAMGATEKTLNAVRDKLIEETANASKYEAMSTQLEAQLKQSNKQASLWQEMFVDLQNRGERKEEKLVGTLAFGAKKQRQVLGALAADSPGAS